MDQWCPHDLRRTARTGLGKLGIAPHIAEKCLNHSLGQMEAIYDRGDYLPERRDALTQWDKHVQKTLGPKLQAVAI